MNETLALTRGRGLVLWPAVVAVAALYALLWGGGLALTHPSPPLDSAEQLVWSYSLQGGYWKHPPVPSWILHALVALFGPSVALPFVATTACVAIALVLAWRLGCEFMPARQSLLAAALTALVSYHGFGADAYNHNSVLLPFQAATVLFFYLATRRGAWHLWGLTGLFAGLALLVKYVAVFPLAGLLLYLLMDRRLHHRRTVAGALLAAGIAGLLCLPHLLWLRANGYQPLEYMRSVTQPLGAGEEVANLASFLVMQLLRVLPMLAVLAWLLRRPVRTAAAPRADGRDRLFLWTAGVAPLLLVLLYAIATGTPLQARWGSNGFLLAGWLALDALRGFALPEGPRAWRPVLLAHVLVWAVAILAVPRLGQLLDLRGRTRFPGAELASLAQGTWQARTGRPLRIVVSDVWLGGNIVAHGEPLAVLIDGDPQRAPWVSSADVRRCGALVLQDLGSGNAEDASRTARWFALATERGIWTVPWRRDDAEPLRIAWGLLPPAPGAGCAL